VTEDGEKHLEPMKAYDFKHI